MTRTSILHWPTAKAPATAEDWFARLHAPDCTASDETAFQAWLQADPRNAEDYSSCEKVTAISSDLSRHHALVDELLADSVVEGRTRLQRQWSRVRTALGAAAAVGALSLGFALMLRTTTASAPPASLTTARGEQRQVALADGSKIQLNTDTELAWRISESERRVELKKGEAFFDVAKDPRRPFVVRVGSSEVRVVGTQFSVREDHGRLEVVVKEGKVDVVPDSTRIRGAESTKVELTPGKHLTYDNSQDLVRIAVVEPERSLAWRTGAIDFDSVTLEEALIEVNRYASKPLVIEDDRLRTLRLSGRFRVGDVDALEFTLRERFGIVAVEQADRITLTANGL